MWVDLAGVRVRPERVDGYWADGDSGKSVIVIAGAHRVVSLPIEDVAALLEEPKPAAAGKKAAKE